MPDEDVFPAMTLRGPALSILWLVVLVLAACDPCFGTSYCGEPAIDVTGFVRVHVEGPAADLPIELRAIDGGLVDDTLSTRTDSAGIFHFRAPAEDEGAVRAEIVFIPEPPCERYVWGVEVTIPTTRAEGAPTYLGSWGVGPLSRVPPEEAPTDCPWESL